jgi:hypothetical protein
MMLTHGWLCRFKPDKTEGQMSLCSCKPIDVGVDSEDIYWDCRMGESFVLVNGAPTIQEGECAEVWSGQSPEISEAFDRLSKRLKRDELYPSEKIYEVADGVHKVINPELYKEREQFNKKMFYGERYEA